MFPSKIPLFHIEERTDSIGIQCYRTSEIKDMHDGKRRFRFDMI